MQALRDAGCAAPAIATSADVDDDIRARMLDAAFDEVIAKPVTLRTPARGGASLSLGEDAAILLDDDEALTALGGHRESLLRCAVLLAVELDGCTLPVRCRYAATRRVSLRGCIVCARRADFAARRHWPNAAAAMQIGRDRETDLADWPKFLACARLRRRRCANRGRM